MPIASGSRYQNDMLRNCVQRSIIKDLTIAIIIRNRGTYEHSKNPTPANTEERPGLSSELPEEGHAQDVQDYPQRVITMQADVINADLLAFIDS